MDIQAAVVSQPVGGCLRENDTAPLHASVTARQKDGRSRQNCPPRGAVIPTSRPAHFHFPPPAARWCSVTKAEGHRRQCRFAKITQSWRTGEAIIVAIVVRSCGECANCQVERS